LTEAATQPANSHPLARLWRKLLSRASQDKKVQKRRTSDFALKQRTCLGETSAESIERLRAISLKAIEAERDELESLRIKDRIGAEDYLGLQEQLDWSELSVLRDNERKIEEI
jgi:hypothetical protein